MPRIIPSNNFTSAWNHYHKKMTGYRIERDYIEFSYFLDKNGVSHMVIPHAEVTDVEGFQDMLRKMIDDLPIIWLSGSSELYRSERVLGSITIKNGRPYMRDYKLNTFNYKGCEFYPSGEDCVLDILNTYE